MTDEVKINPNLKSFNISAIFPLNWSALVRKAEKILMSLPGLDLEIERVIKESRGVDTELLGLSRNAEEDLKSLEEGGCSLYMEIRKNSLSLRWRDDSGKANFLEDIANKKGFNVVHLLEEALKTFIKEY